MNSQLVLLSRDQHVVTLTLNREAFLNALNRDLLEALQAQLTILSADPTLRVLILSGAGERAFCAGADLKERLTMSLEETESFVQLISAVADEIAQFPVPTIAAINGVAFGGGLELALACDLRVMHEKAQVGLTECALGIIPGAGGTQRLPKMVGVAKAKEMIFSAKRISADEALNIGLVNAIGLEQTNILAEQIVVCAPLSVKAAKKAIDQGDEASCYRSILHTSDRLEGLRAFSEKRKPIYKCV